MFCLVFYILFCFECFVLILYFFFIFGVSRCCCLFGGGLLVVEQGPPLALWAGGFGCGHLGGGITGGCLPGCLHDFWPDCVVCPPHGRRRPPAGDRPVQRLPCHGRRPPATQVNLENVSDCASLVP